MLVDRPTIPQRNETFLAETLEQLLGVDFVDSTAQSALVTLLHIQRRVTTMGWLDLNEYVLIEGAARDRLDDCRRAVGPRVLQSVAAPSSLRAMLYVSSALRAKPRDIDRYIDYFGDPVLRQR